MVVLERHWWLRLVWAALAVVGAAGFAVWYVWFLLPLDLSVAWRTVPELLVAGDIVGLLLALALDAVLRAKQAHARAVRRATAITGYQDAMPLARAEGDGQPVPREALAHVEVSWPGARMNGWESLVGIVFTIGLAVYLFVLAAEFMLIFSGVQVPISFPPSSPLPRQWAAPHDPELLLILDLVGLALWILSAVPLSLDRIFLVPARVVASAEGITRYSVWGRKTFIPWHEVRLLEVAQTRQRLLAAGMVGPPWWYTVYGRDSRLRWALQGALPGWGVDVSARLALAVTAHTGLQPRTLVPELMAGTEPARPPWLARLTRRSGFVIGLCATAIAVVALYIADPPFIMRAAPVWVIVWAISLIVDSISRRRRRRSRASGARVAAAPGFAPGAIYEVTVGSHTLFLFNLGFFAIVGAVAAAGCGYVLVAEMWMHQPVVGSAPLPMGVAAAFWCFTVGGMLLLMVCARAKDTIVVADDAGVRKRWLLGNTFIPWASVEVCNVRRLNGRPWYYRVWSNGRRASIGWPVSPFDASRTPQVPGATQLTPGQMAALVAERSGRPIQTAGRR